MRRWMLDGNISRKGYGNALIGRYGGCFEERYNEVYDDRVYRAKGLDAPAKFSPTPTRRAMHNTEEDSKIWEGESANNRTLTLVRRTHALIIGNSLSSQEIHKETSTPRRSLWGFGYPCASSPHGTWGYSIYSNPAEISDPFSS